VPNLATWKRDGSVRMCDGRPFLRSGVSNGVMSNIRLEDYELDAICATRWYETSVMAAISRIERPCLRPSSIASRRASSAFSWVDNLTGIDTLG